MNKTLADILRSYIPDGDGYNSEYAHNLNAAADALESQQSAPAGYVMVPVEPTPEMLLAGGHVNSEWLNDNAPIGESRYVTPMLDVYRSMLAAAPQPVALVCDECGGNGAGGDHEEDCSKAPQPVAQDGWIPVSERFPEGTVLASYTNNYNKSRIIRAKYVQKFTQESEDIDNFDAQYDEETDTYYDCEGWYEMIDNWDSYSSVAVTEGTVTHWMNLPAAPKVKP